MPCDRCGHTHERCAAHRRDGQPCTQWPVRGADKCKMHAGRKASDLIGQHQATRAAATYGLPVDIDPHDALRAEVWRSAGHVQWLQGQVNALGKDELRQWDEAPGGAGRWSPSILIDLYHRERAHHVKVCKTAIDAGLAEREVRLAEQQGRVIVKVLEATLADLGVEVTPEVAETVGRHLRAVPDVA